jgi:hypothetical protein
VSGQWSANTLCSTILVDLGGSSNRFHVAAWVLLTVLLALRLASLAQPAGADQGLYAYVGQRILQGDVPYRDAWDQKPPGIHATYALMMAVWPNASVVALADLVATALTAWLLYVAARQLRGSTGAGLITAILYLLLANPAYTRLGGVRIRAQCETFIGLLVAAAVALAASRVVGRPRPASRDVFFAGVFVGLACVFKYNAVVYALPLAVAMLVAHWRLDAAPRARLAGLARHAGVAALGMAAPLALMVAIFGLAGALEDLYLATVVYNLQYSGETYSGPGHALAYLFTFPVRHARLDSLWMLGGAGTSILILAARRQPSLAIVAAWVASACLAIGINGSRGLPQYFVQAWPPLALAAGVGAAVIWPHLRTWGRVAMIGAVLLAVPRVTQFDKMWTTTTTDAMRLFGGIDRAEYLSRFGRPDSGDKYSALAVDELAATIARTTSPWDTVFVFGFSPWAYVGSGRESASRFFWSRPVIIGFEQGRPRYGVPGLLDELTRREPRLVVLQARDWDPDGLNSDEFFLGEPRLAGWLERHYVPSGRMNNFRIWTRAATP